MSKLAIAFFVLATSLVCTNAQAVTASFTLFAAADTSGPIWATPTVGYCGPGQCVRCDGDWWPECEPSIWYGFGGISNAYLSDGKEVSFFAQQTTDIEITINTGTNPGANYITSVTINCDGGTATFVSPYSYFRSDARYVVSLPVAGCMTDSHAYSVVIN